MTSDTRAQRLVDEFEDGSAQLGGFNTRHGIAAVLTHLTTTYDSYSDGDEFWHGVTTNTLDDLVDALTAPTLLDRALAGDWQAARQFLHDAGFTDQHGQLLPQYQPIPETTNG
jgi:hypothetical protein